MRIPGFSAVALTGFAFVACIGQAAATETVLYSFPDANLGNPIGQLTLRNGSLLGTASGFTVFGDGQVFELSQSGGSWKLKTLLAFNKTNGSVPRAGLIADSNGALYGTTAEGGAHGKGNVFKLWKSGGGWTSATLWDFGANDADGADPECDLVMDRSGALYGTTALGGTNEEGTLFRLSQSGGVWKEHVIHRFGGNYEGYEPVAGFLMSRNGALYGTTYSGGAVAYGTVFSLKRSGGAWNADTLHNFGGKADGEYPIAGLIEGPSGTFYGTTLFGGKIGGGTAFALTRSGAKWTKTVLHDFGVAGDGSEPYARLLLAGDTLYGTTEYGGTYGAGTLFSLVQTGGVWKETVLYNFGATGDAANPTGAVIMNGQGALYGTSFSGGTLGNGTVWEFTP